MLNNIFDLISYILFIPTKLGIITTLIIGLFVVCLTFRFFYGMAGIWRKDKE